MKTFGGDSLTLDEIERSLNAALFAADGSPASLREYMANVSTLIHAIGPCYEMAHDEQVRIIEIMAVAMRTRLLQEPCVVGAIA